MKNITYNDYVQRINKVVAYINNHLDETLDLKTLANEAALSDFHFHRIFKALKGEAIGGYITRLRLEATARLLLYTALTIEEIAFNIGYETPASLSKAFKKQYSISPTEYGSLDYGKAYEQLWAVIKAQKLFTKGIESICISYDDPKITEGSLQRSDVCLAIHKPVTPQEEVSCKTLAGGKYAVFFYQGSYENLSQVYDTAVRWVIDHQYTLREEPFFEKYLNDARRTPKEKLKTEIYIPIN